MSSGISGKFAGILLAFIFLIVGFYIFPGIHTYILSIDSTGFGTIMNTLYVMMPYIIIGVVILGCWYFIKGRSQ